MKKNKLQESLPRAKPRGFTLLELLIVIGILAILATVAILVINPAELLRRARDSARISDLRSIKAALGLYLTDISSPDLDIGGARCTNEASKSLFLSIPSLAANCPATPQQGHALVTVAAANLGLVNGSGWIPVRFTDIIMGSPLGSLPIDPSNTCSATVNEDLFYIYSCHQTRLSFILAANLESTYYKTTIDLRAKDGGTAATIYEVGTDFANSGPATSVLAL